MKTWLVLLAALAAAFLLSGCFVTAGYGYNSGPPLGPSWGYYGHYPYGGPSAYSYTGPRGGYMGLPPASGGFWAGGGSRRWGGDGFRGHHHGHHGHGGGRHGWR